MLTAAEIVEVRRQAGYPAAGPVAGDAIAAVLAGLVPEAEVVLRVRFLASLSRLETALIGTSDNLDTKSAAVWVRNEQELAERTLLYRSLRIAMCRFLGIDPGPGIYDMVIVEPGADTGTGGGTTNLALPPAVFVV